MYSCSHTLPEAFDDGEVPLLYTSLTHGLM